MSYYTQPDEEQYPSETAQQRQERREYIASKTAQFIAEGGIIQYIPKGATGFKETNKPSRLAYGETSDEFN